MYLCLLRRLIRRTNARELRNLALARLLVQALWIARLCDLERYVDKDLDEGERLVGARGDGVQVAGCGAVRFVGGDEGGDCDCARVGEEFSDLGKASILVIEGMVW